MSDLNQIKDPGLFTVPDGYFSELEDRLHERIHTSRSGMSVMAMKVKPALMLTLMFGIIAGFGYLASKVTGLLYTDPLESGDPITAMIEEGWLESSFIYAYTDEIDVENALINSLEENVILDEELAGSIETMLTEEEIIEYLNLE
ncbi:MAG TPA: hypothetical protein IAC04_02055 [Candidatus Coprenecus stercoravium]|uniref:Uncharacterized protein n=1 Tax=Candidatus Coprenecus stercoravium TaxID=2840735 RepID=A0A9D2GQ90_9BACT|nr:hypothetical protein [Candidatus Coprenecus stercoravium]